MQTYVEVNVGKLETEMVLERFEYNGIHEGDVSLTHGFIPRQPFLLDLLHNLSKAQNYKYLQSN